MRRPRSSTTPNLVWHELEFYEGGSFTYVVRDTSGGYLGCAYLYPMGRRTALTEELLDYDVDVSWWVTTAAYEQGYYPKLYAALQHWLANDVPLGRAYYSNLEIPGYVRGYAAPPSSDADHMRTGRVTILVTCGIVAGLGVVLALTWRNQANQIATVVSAAAAVAAVGVAIWAGRPSRPAGTTLRVTGTGSATAGPGGTATSGLSAPAGGLPDNVEVTNTDADASGGGDANSGVRLT